MVKIPLQRSERKIFVKKNLNWFGLKTKSHQLTSIVIQKHTPLFFQLLAQSFHLKLGYFAGQTISEMIRKMNTYYFII